MSPKLCTTLLLATLATSHQALADLSCESFQPKAKLALTAANEHCANLGFAVQVTVHSPDLVVTYCGSKPAPTKEFFMSKQTIDLHDAKGAPAGTLSITKQPKFCGRGHCSSLGGVDINANLILGDNQETYFYCDEKAL